MEAFGVAPALSILGTALTTSDWGGSEPGVVLCLLVRYSALDWSAESLRRIEKIGFDMPNTGRVEQTIPSTTILVSYDAKSA